MSTLDTPPVIHPSTKLQLDNILKNPPNSLAIIGARGLGKSTLAQWLVRAMSGQPGLNIEDSPLCLFITSENGISIKAEQIEAILKFTRLRTVGKTKFRRYIIIERADMLTTHAQSSLLKLLEEPPLDTSIILTIENSRAMLPTVLSRLQTISVKAPTKDQLRALYDQKDFERLYLLTDGFPGLMNSINADSTEHPLILALEKVRQILASNTFERLNMINELAKDKTETALVLEVMTRMAAVSVDQAVLKGDEMAVDKWLKILQAASRAQTEMGKNANTKLMLMNTFLNLV